jgi:hypothetical protein
MEKFFKNYFCASNEELMEFLKLITEFKNEERRRPKIAKGAR